MVVATTLVISAVFITLMTSLDLKRTQEIYNFLLFTSKKTRQPQETKRRNRPKFSINFLPSFLRKTNLPRLAVCLEGKMKLSAFVLFFCFTFFSCNCLRFGQFQISRSTMCFTLPKSRLSNVVDFSRGLQTSQK